MIASFTAHLHADDNVNTQSLGVLRGSCRFPRRLHVDTGSTLSPKCVQIIHASSGYYWQGLGAKGSVITYWARRCGNCHPSPAV